jgi:hypothetical protein
MTTLATFFDQVLREGNYSRSMAAVQALLAGAQAEKSTAAYNPLGATLELNDSTGGEGSAQSYRSEADGKAALVASIGALATAPAALRAGDDAKTIVEAFAADGWPGAESWAGVLEAGFGFDEAGDIELVDFTTPDAAPAPTTETPEAATSTAPSSPATTDTSSPPSSSPAAPAASPEEEAEGLLDELEEHLDAVPDAVKKDLEEWGETLIDHVTKLVPILKRLVPSAEKPA